MSLISTAIQDKNIEFEILDRYYKSHKSYFINLLLPLLVVITMWPNADQTLLLIWAVGIAIGILWLSELFRRYAKLTPGVEQVDVWGRRVTLVSTYNTCMWALLILMVYPGSSAEQQIFLILLLALLFCSAWMYGMYWFPLFYARTIPIGVALVYHFVEVGGFVSWMTILYLVLAFPGLLFTTKRLNASMRNEIRLRNESLLYSEQLNIKADEAQKAVQSKSKFLAAASHDLRQPLHALSLFVDVLKESKSDDERSLLFSRIDASLDALKKLFNSLLDISRLDAEVIKPEVSHFQLKQLLQSVTDEFQEQASRKKLSIKLRTCSLTVFTDSLLLERIVRNLLSNALRYTESGGVLIACRQRKNHVLLQVWDTGIGIPEEHQQEIFEEFHQLHNPQRDRTKGLGLGLALVRRLCGLLNLPLVLKSQPGRGTVFSIEIPLGNAELIPQRRKADRNQRWSLTGYRILVIDDEQDILSAMDSLLSKWGCDVVVAEDLDGALNAINEKDFVPQLILSDMRLRDNKTGLEAIEGLQQHFQTKIPSILITGDTAPERIKQLKASELEVLTKPVKPLHLRSVLQSILSNPEV